MLCGNSLMLLLSLTSCRQGDMSELKVVGDPQAAERLCDDEDDSDAVSPSVGVQEPPAAPPPVRLTVSVSLRPPETLAAATAATAAAQSGRRDTR